MRPMKEGKKEELGAEELGAEEMAAHKPQA
jgi:hypothetical protein